MLCFHLFIRQSLREEVFNDIYLLNVFQPLYHFWHNEMADCCSGECKLSGSP